MSLGLAEKLSVMKEVGIVGMREIFDPPRVLEGKVKLLAHMIRTSRHLVVFTGAGISTSCGIPDFRGPKGIWTSKRQGNALPETSVPLHRAMPSFTHMALVVLEKADVLKFLVSQNIDGLHLRSGILRKGLAELHGNCFTERCLSCGAEYVRDFEIETIGLKETKRCCSNLQCGSNLWDTDDLPPMEMDLAGEHCKKADLVLCLGTSLQIHPACDLPRECLAGGGKIVIVNLQKTPCDEKAKLVIHGPVDKVMAEVMNILGMHIPPFVRVDLFQIILTQVLSRDQTFIKWTTRIASVHGKQAPLPFVKSVEVSSKRLNMKKQVLHKQPFYVERRTMRVIKSFDILLKLNLSRGCKCEYTQLTIPVDFENSVKRLEEDKESIIQSLKDTAIANGRCGQTAVVERRAILDPKTDIIVHAIVTNITEFDSSSKGTSEVSPLGNGSHKRKNGSSLDSGVSWKQTKPRSHRR